mgnify:CR=1 FL=1
MNLIRYTFNILSLDEPKLLAFKFFENEVLQDKEVSVAVTPLECLWLEPYMSTLYLIGNIDKKRMWVW